MVSRLPRPSVLLQHIHGTIPALTSLYAEATSATAFPPDPTTPEQGERVLDFFCSELGMGRDALSRWRQRTIATACQYWVVKPEGPPTTTAADLPPPVAVAGRKLAAPAKSADPLFLQPRQQDVDFMRSAMTDLRLVPSPLVTLSPPPCPLAPCDDSSPLDHPRAELTAATTAVNDKNESTAKVNRVRRLTVEAHTTRASSEATSSRFYATRRLPAGMFVLSLPTEAVLMARPPPSTDAVLSFFLHLDDLIGQLVAAEEEGPTHPHHGYVRYLKDSVVPCRNLPFLGRAAMEKLVGPCPTGDGTPRHPLSSAAVAAGPAPDDPISPAWCLWQYFHETMQGEPLSPYLRERLHKDEYAWWVSTVLARRTGAAMLVPVIDKLNHHPLPNCSYTMSSDSALCGLDVLDNLFAGVPLDLLYQPYVHVFTIRNVEPGEELTLCYASPDQSHFRPASPHAPPAPPLSPSEGTTGRAAPAHPTTTTVEDWDDALASLFPSATAVATPPLHAADDVAHVLQRVAHPSSQQEVHTTEGRARWQLQWGFVPASDAVFSAKDLEEMAAIVAERRVDTRVALFPPAKSL